MSSSCSKEETMRKVKYAPLTIGIGCLFLSSTVPLALYAGERKEDPILSPMVVNLVRSYQSTLPASGQVCPAWSVTHAVHLTFIADSQKFVSSFRMCRLYKLIIVITLALLLRVSGWNLWPNHLSCWKSAQETQISWRGCFSESLRLYHLEMVTGHLI